MGWCHEPAGLFHVLFDMMTCVCAHTFSSPIHVFNACRQDTNVFVQVEEEEFCIYIYIYICSCLLRYDNHAQSIVSAIIDGMMIVHIYMYVCMYVCIYVYMYKYMAT